MTIGDLFFGLTVIGLTFGSWMLTFFAALGITPRWTLAVTVPCLLIFALAWYAGVVGDPDEPAERSR